MAQAHSRDASPTRKVHTPDSLTPAPTPANGKPSKPYEGFPLFAHATGRWAKKIRGKLHYFGKVADGWEKALDLYKAQADDLHAGRKPRESREGSTIKDLCNHFYNAKKTLLDSGELAPRTFEDYERITDLIIAHFGKTRLLADLNQDEFARLRDRMARKWSPVTVANTIQKIRVVFKFAFDTELIDRPVRFGPGFKRPTKKTLRLHKAKQGKKLFTAEEIRRLIDAAGVPLKAMILLGINCGFGNADCGTLPFSALDLERGWIDYPRPKTGVARRCPLWPETAAAIREAIAKRPTPDKEEFKDLVFLTKYRDSWHKDVADSPVTKETRKLLNKLQIDGHRNFYCLRHTFQTCGDEAKDPIATRYIMGHADQSMSGVYREDVSDGRLKLVTDHVRAWLFGNGVDTPNVQV